MDSHGKASELRAATIERSKRIAVPIRVGAISTELELVGHHEHSLRKAVRLDWAGVRLSPNSPEGRTLKSTQ